MQLTSPMQTQSSCFCENSNLILANFTDAALFCVYSCFKKTQTLIWQISQMGHFFALILVL